MLLSLLLTAVLTVGAADPAGAPPKQAPLRLEVEGGVLDLAPTDKAGVYRSTIPFRVHAGSVLPRWRVVAQPGRISEPVGGNAGRTVKAPRVLLLPRQALDHPGRDWTGGPLDIEGTTVIALGGPTSGRIHEINSYDIVVEADPLSAPGHYRGTLRIIPEVPGGRGAPAPADIEYEWNVVELLAVNVLQEALDFGEVGPGLSESHNHATFEVHSNHHQAEVMIDLSTLEKDGNDAGLPPSATCLGCGPDPMSARHDAEHAPFGRNQIRLVVGPGSHKYAIVGRLSVPVDAEAGVYGGQIMISSRVIR